MAVGRGTALPYPPPPGLKDTDPDPSGSGVTVTARQLADESTATLERATRVLAVAVRAVVDYAPAAPAELLDEAVIRFGSYLLTSDVGAVRSETIGPLTVEHVVNHAAAFRNSGAAMLLTRYKIRRAGTIG